MKIRIKKICPTGSKYRTIHSLSSIIVRANSISNNIDFDVERSIAIAVRALANDN